MCVIAIVRDPAKRPSEKMIEQMWETNDDGGGAAWREKCADETGKKVLQVRWNKGIESVEEMKELARTLPIPYILHFRIASCGGVRQELTHPFPIDEKVPEFLQGRTGGFVLFHNGHWGKWQDYSMDMTIHLRAKVPAGAWSDSRAMAWAAANYGNDVLNFIGEKCVIFSPTELEVFRKDWELVDGVLCSNKHFEIRQWNQTGHAYSQRMCKFGNCTRKDLNTLGLCPVHEAKPLVVIPAPNPRVIDTTATVTPLRTNEEGVLPDDSADEDTLPLIPGAVPPVSQPGGAGAVDPFVQLQALRELRCRHKINRREFDDRKRVLEAQIKKMGVKQHTVTLH